MWKLIFKTLVLALLIVGGAIAQAENEKHKQAVARLDEIEKFFKENKISGRSYGSIEKGVKFNEKTVGDTISRWSIHGLARKEEALIFQMTGSFAQTLYDLDGAGKPKVETAKDSTRTQAIVCELNALKSAAKVVGYCRSFANDRFDSTGWAEVITDAKIVEGKLVLAKSGGTLGNCFEGTDAYYPCDADATDTISLVNGKLRIEYKSKTYRIDPETYEKVKLESEDTYVDNEL